MLTISYIKSLVFIHKIKINSGIHCSGGSDAPVEEPNPFLGMYDAIYRPTGKRIENPDPADILRWIKL